MLELSFTYYSLSSLFIASSSFLLGIFILRKNPGSKIHRSLFLWCLSIAAWSAFYFIWQLETEAGPALLWTRLLMVGAIWVPIAYLYFVTTFLGMGERKKKFLLSVSGLSFVFTLLLATPLMVNRVEPAGGFMFWPKPGILYTPFLLMFFGVTLYAAYLSYRALKTETSSVRRAQIKFMLIAIGISIAGGSTNYFLWYNIQIPPYGNAFVSIYVFTTIYTIIRYRLLGFRLVARRTTQYIVLATVTYGFFHLIAVVFLRVFGGFYSAWSIILGGAIALLFIWAFLKFEKWLEKVSNEYFFGQLYSYQETLRDLGQELSKVTSIKKIIQSLTKSISQALTVDKVAALLDHNKAFHLEKIQGVEYDKGLDVVEPNHLTDYLIETEVAVVKEELELMAGDVFDLNERDKLEKVVKDMESINIAVAAPLFVRERLRGFMVLGSKVTDSAFTKEDIGLLDSVSGQAAIAIENARLYYGMEKEVSERTLELREANQRLEDLLEVKSEFLDIASHQLRTPTSIIRGMLSMVVDGSAGKQEKEFIYDSFQASERLTVIINDLLDATELEGKEMKVELKEVSLFELLEKSVKLFEKPAQTKGIDLIFKPAPNLRTSPLLRLDTDRFRSAVENLIDNSVKYTRVGSVTVSARQTPNQVFITVKDTGIGVRKDDLGKLFQKFSRGEDASKMAPNGSGLGLFIAKKIVEAHDGKIEASSPGRGEGTSFLITLPVI